MKPTQFTIGRDGAHADVVPAGNHLDTVSRCHLKVTADWSKETFRIQDNRTPNGTFAKENGKWVAVDKAVVGLHTPLRLGKLETSFDNLMDKINRIGERRPAEQKPAPTRPKPATPRIVRRDPTTGQIIE